jgi:stage IV sporulation protein FB
MKIGRVFGIDLILSKFLIVLFIVYFFLDIHHLAVIVFGVVLVHEISHVIAALYLGMVVETIKLFPFGGVVGIRGNEAYSVKKEILVSLPGPAVNFILAVLVWAVQGLGIGNKEYLSFILKTTVLMGFFNLLPILPLDGGRMFRAFLARYTGYFSATRVTALIGQLIAVGLFIWGIHELWFNQINFHWLLIAAYLFYIAGKEKKFAFLHFICHLSYKKKEIRTACILPAVILAAERNLSIIQVIHRLIPDRYLIVYVIDEQGKYLGSVTEVAIIDAVFSGNINMTLEEVLNYMQMKD